MNREDWEQAARDLPFAIFVVVALWLVCAMLFAVAG
jgi:hypothetical protein